MANKWSIYSCAKVRFATEGRTVSVIDSTFSWRAETYDRGIAPPRPHLWKGVSHRARESNPVHNWQTIPFGSRCKFRPQSQSIKSKARIYTRVYQIYKKEEKIKMKFNKGHLARVSGKVISRIGLYALEDKVIDAVVASTKNVVKNKLCTEIKLIQLHDIEIVTDIIQKFDKNFSRHIDNGHDPKAKPIIASSYLLRIRRDILVYVNGKHETANNGMDRITLTLTVFGEGQKKFVKFINNKIKEKRSDTFLIYNITADREGYWSCSSSPAAW